MQLFPGKYSVTSSPIDELRQRGASSLHVITMSAVGQTRRGVPLDNADAVTDAAGVKPAHYRKPALSPWTLQGASRPGREGGGGGRPPSPPRQTAGSWLFTGR